MDRDQADRPERSAKGNGGDHQAAGVVTKVAQVFLFDKPGGSRSARPRRRRSGHRRTREITISAIADPASPRAHHPGGGRQPTIQMVFGINSCRSPGAQYVTTGSPRAALSKELERNVATRGALERGDAFQARPRVLTGRAHRDDAREGFEMSSASRGHLAAAGGSKEPLKPVVEVPPEAAAVMGWWSAPRQGQPLGQTSHDNYTCVFDPRGIDRAALRLLNATQGRRSCTTAGRWAGRGRHPRQDQRRARFDDWARGRLLKPDGLQERPRCSWPRRRGLRGDDRWKPVGRHARQPTGEEVTNIRAAGSDRNILLKPPRVLSLEAALDHIEGRARRGHAQPDCLRKVLLQSPAPAARGGAWLIAW